jgi:CNT family concentrative nucleoside transporter
MHTQEVLNFSISNILHGLLGLVVLIIIAFLLSENKKAINWRLVAGGLALQIVFALLVFKVPFVRGIFEGLASFFIVVLQFTEAGSTFVLGAWPDVTQVTNGLNGQLFTVGYIFAFKVLPTVIFFSALTSLLYYLNILQKIVFAIAWVMNKTMRLSGSESLAAAANIFIGQTEAPLVVKPYIANMTRSEILCLMTGGMATIAGGVLAAYVGFLGGSDPVQQKLFATHLLTASIMSAPAALVLAKILVPEVGEVNKEMAISKDKLGSNVLEAISNGTTDGLRLAVNVGAMLLVFTAFMAMFNYIFKDLIGHYTGLNTWVVANTNGSFDGFSLQAILGFVFAPVSWIIGIPKEDILAAGQLLGEKTILNEFYAYASFAKLKDTGVLTNPHSIVILTYALCGFSNFASIGIQIGGISSIAPNQKSTLSQLGIKALVGGTMACLLTATIAGMFF